MKKFSFLIWIAFFSLFVLISEAQTRDPDSLLQRFVSLYNSGDLINAEKVLVSMLNSTVTLEERHLNAVYNNLGVINTMLGKYSKALEFYNKAETLITGKKQYLGNLITIYSNIGLLNFIGKSYDQAIGYYEKSIRIYNSLKTRDSNALFGLSSTFLNLGIALINTGDYNSALAYFKRSSEIKLKYNMTGLALVYLNMAKVKVKLNNPVEAEFYYLKSINRFTEEFNEDYYRLAEVYFDYGLFLRSAGREPEALEVHRKALSICLKNYGEKHTLTALSYKHLGDHYFYQSDYAKALEYYQKSLISVVRNFNDPDTDSNPSIDSALFDIRLHDNLKSKANVLELLALAQNDQADRLRLLNKSLETIELTLHLTERIRNSYISEEDRIYLSENEK